MFSPAAKPSGSLALYVHVLVQIFRVTTDSWPWVQDRALARRAEAGLAASGVQLASPEGGLEEPALSVA